VDVWGWICDHPWWTTLIAGPTVLALALMVDVADGLADKGASDL
jgi:hypothetical protein